MKNASVWAFSALFGCISLFGPGWHRFFDHPFHASPTCQGGCDDHAHFHAESHHEHDGEDAEANFAAVDVHHEHDCPICSFFAQAQWAVVPAPDAFELAFRCAITVAQQSCWVERIGIYQSRAPPGSSPIC